MSDKTVTIEVNGVPVEARAGQMLIEVTDRRDEFAAALTAKGVQALDDGKLLLIEQARESDSDLIRDAAVESGAHIRRLLPERRTLTDIFKSRPA